MFLADDRQFMARCAEMAQLAREHGEAGVGAIVVCAGQIVSEEFEQVRTRRDVTAHAEILALRSACERLETLDLSGCTLYTNVEPCWMCSYAIREASVGRVVVGRAISDIGGITSRFPLLTDDVVPGWESPPRVVWVECG